MPNVTPTISLHSVAFFGICFGLAAVVAKGVGKSVAPRVGTWGALGIEVVVGAVVAYLIALTLVKLFPPKPKVQ